MSPAHLSLLQLFDYYPKSAFHTETSLGHNLREPKHKPPITQHTFECLVLSITLLLISGVIARETRILLYMSSHN